MMTGTKKEKKEMWYPNLENKNPVAPKFSGSPQPKQSGNGRIHHFGKNLAESRRISVGNFMHLN